MRFSKIMYTGESVGYVDNVRFDWGHQIKVKSNHQITADTSFEFESKSKILDLQLQAWKSNLNVHGVEAATVAIADQSIRGVSLSRLLKVGSLCVAVACSETLLFLALGVPELGILNPFAAFLFLVASPFFYVMGKLAKY